MKVIHSRDVVFDEKSMPGIQKEKEPSHKYVALEIEEDSVVSRKLPLQILQAEYLRRCL